MHQVKGKTNKVALFAPALSNDPPTPPRGITRSGANIIAHPSPMGGRLPSSTVEGLEEHKRRNGHPSTSLKDSAQYSLGQSRADDDGTGGESSRYRLRLKSSSKGVWGSGSERSTSAGTSGGDYSSRDSSWRGSLGGSGYVGRVSSYELAPHGNRDMLALDGDEGAFFLRGWGMGDGRSGMTSYLEIVGWICRSTKFRVTCALMCPNCGRLPQNLFRNLDPIPISLALPRLPASAEAGPRCFLVVMTEGLLVSRG